MVYIYNILYKIDFSYFSKELKDIRLKWYGKIDKKYKIIQNIYEIDR